jgi:hypothetical protein
VAASEMLDLTPAWDALRGRSGRPLATRSRRGSRSLRRPAGDGLGRALWWLGDPQEDRARRAAYAEYKRRRPLQAANLATYLAGEHRIAGRRPPRTGGSRARSGCWRTRRRAQGRGWLEIEVRQRSAGEVQPPGAARRCAATLARELRNADGGCRTRAAGPRAWTPATWPAGWPCSTRRGCGRRRGRRSARYRRHLLHDASPATGWRFRARRHGAAVVSGFTGRRGYTPLHLWCARLRGLSSPLGRGRADAELLIALRGYDELGGSGGCCAGTARGATSAPGRLGEAENDRSHED